MVIIFNKSNRPIGVAGQSVLPDREIRVKDKDAYCAVFDEDGNETGEKQIIPGLAILEQKNMVSIRFEEEKKATKKVEKKEAEPEAEAPAEKKTTRSRTTKKAAE